MRRLKFSVLVAVTALVPALPIFMTSAPAYADPKECPGNLERKGNRCETPSGRETPQRPRHGDHP